MEQPHGGSAAVGLVRVPRAGEGVARATPRGEWSFTRVGRGRRARLVDIFPVDLQNGNSVAPQRRPFSKVCFGFMFYSTLHHRILEKKEIQQLPSFAPETNRPGDQIKS